MLEDELRLLGISWASNKHRGPAEFLGLLLSDPGGVPSISLTRKRRDSLLQEIAEWRHRSRECRAARWARATRRSSRAGRVVGEASTGTPNWLSWLGARLLNLRSGVRFPLKGRACAMAPS